MWMLVMAGLLGAGLWLLCPTDSEWATMVATACLVAALLVGAYGLVTTLDKESARYEQLMAECLADGHKEYQCVGLLRSGGR